MPPQQEKTALLTPAEPSVDRNMELVALSSMGLQVSLATFARIGLYSIDYAFLGHLGTAELAAASLSTAWTSLPLLTVWSGANAILTLSGQAWGAQNGVLTGVWMQMGVVLLTICMVPVFAYYWCVGYFLKYSTDDLDVIRLGTRFARILSLSIWPNLIYVCVRLYFQSMGILFPTTVVGLLTIFVAVGANYFLIYGAFGWEGLGFDGSPWATVVASWFQPIALISYCMVYKKMHLQAWGGWNFREFTPQRIRTYAAMAGPISFTNFIMNLANSSLALVAASMGPDIIAANAIASGYWRLLWALFWGFGSATQIRVANYLGAGRPQAAIQTGKLGLYCTVVCVLVLGLVTILLKEDIFRLYTNDSRLLQLCLLVEPIFVAAFVVQSLEMLETAILTAMGEVQITAITGTIVTWFIELPYAYVVGVMFDRGLVALWESIGLLELVKLFVFSHKLSKIDWTQMAQRAQQQMKVTEESEAEDEETLEMAMADGGNAPFGGGSGLLSPVTPMHTPTPRRYHQWDPRDNRLTPKDSMKERSYA